MPRKTAFKILLEYSRTKKNIDLNNISNFKNLNQKNKNLAIEIIFGVIRFNKRLDYIINHMAPKTPDLKGKLKAKAALVLKIAIYQIIFLDKIPNYAAVNESIKLLHNPFEKTYINKFLRFLCDNKDLIAYPDDKISYLSVFYSYPSFLIERWLKMLDEETLLSVLEAGNTPPPITLRVNTLKIKFTDFLNNLEKKQIAYYNIDNELNSISVKNINPSDIEGFKSGLFYVQDKTASKAGFATKASPGDNILDLCAAPGGKTTHMAELMNDKGKIIALDVSDSKINKIKENINRLGIKIIEPLKYDGENLIFLKKESFDKILIDAPCSNTGVLSRRPEARWNLSTDLISNLKDIQWNLLNNAANYVKKDGSIVYSTCSIDKEENNDVITLFLSKNSQFDLIKEETTLPVKHKQDGGYFAVLKRII